ncbi:MAG: diacylglyceryl transferase [Bacteroidetes bacterium]|nr:diacylglyceryl transferase [Bacteroidota bacterium]
MYPRVTDFFNDIFGTSWNLPIQSYGFFLALTFVVASLLIRKELKRKEKTGIVEAIKKKAIIGRPATISELLTTALAGFIIGFKIIGLIFDYDQFSLNPQEYIFSLEGNLIGGAALAIIQTFRLYKNKEAKKLDKPEKVIKLVPLSELTNTLIIIAAVSGIIGAKIFHQLEYPEEFFADPIGSLLSFSGLTFYGGLITAALALTWYCKKNNIPWSELADAVAPALMIGYAIGRIGCQVSGDGDWGIVNLAQQPEWLSFLPEWTWAYDYPNNVLSKGIPIEGCEGIYCYKLAEPVYPTPIYETTMCSIFFGVLWFLRKRIKVSGVLFSMYLIMNGFERFIIEKIRVNSTYEIIGFEITQAEIISSILILLGIAGIIYFKKKNLLNIKQDAIN